MLHIVKNNVFYWISYFFIILICKSITFYLLADTEFIYLGSNLKNTFFPEILFFICLFLLGIHNISLKYVTGEIVFPVALCSITYSTSMLHPIGSGADRLIFGGMILLTLLCTGLIVSFMFSIRWIFRRKNQSKRQKVLIYGTGPSGLQLLNSLFHSEAYLPVGFVQSEPLNRKHLAGLKVYSEDILAAKKFGKSVHLVLNSTPDIGRTELARLSARVFSQGYRLKTVPPSDDIIAGKADIADVRNIEPEQLLGRDVVPPQPELMRMNIEGRSVLISGSGGSIGSEIARQVLANHPRRMVLVDISEFALFRIHQELLKLNSGLSKKTDIIPVIASVSNKSLMDKVLAENSVETVYHAAAYKHVPMVEENKVSGVFNNVFGTLRLAEASKNTGVRNFILISTDKAVRPTNVMGASKRVAELVCQLLAQEGSGTIFSIVRFGNVLGTSGSVIPTFLRQIADGGPVTVTHREITRYFMTAEEAAALVIQAGALSEGGEIFLLDMGSPVKILDLAFNMIASQGYNPVELGPTTSFERGRDIPISITGLRKGEKLFEELLVDNQSDHTLHPRIFRDLISVNDRDFIVGKLKHLYKACRRNDAETVSTILTQMKIEYHTTPP